EGLVKILDFGIARGANARTVTITGGGVGTLNYMSPEQLQGHRVDARSDQFSLGAVLYEILTGRRAFSGGIDSGLLTKILSGQPEPLTRQDPDLPATLQSVVDRALEKQPEHRYADMEAMRQALEAARADVIAQPPVERRAVFAPPSAVTAIAT